MVELSLARGIGSAVDDDEPVEFDMLTSDDPSPFCCCCCSVAIAPLMSSVIKRKTSSLILARSLGSTPSGSLGAGLT
jgi:hypothetical protein